MCDRALIIIFVSRTKAIKHQPIWLIFCCDCKQLSDTSGHIMRWDVCEFSFDLCAILITIGRFEPVLNGYLYFYQDRDEL